MNCSEKIILNFIHLFLEERNTKMIRKWNPQNNEYSFYWENRIGIIEIFVYPNERYDSTDPPSPPNISMEFDLYEKLIQWVPEEIIFAHIAKYCNHQIELYTKEPWFF